MSGSWWQNGWDNSNWRQQGWHGRDDRSKGDSSSGGKGDSSSGCQGDGGKGNAGKGNPRRNRSEDRRPSTADGLVNTVEYRQLETDEQRVAYMITCLWPLNQREDMLPKRIRIGPLRHQCNYTLKARPLAHTLRCQLHLDPECRHRNSAVFATTEAWDPTPHYECIKSAKGWDVEGAVLHLILVKSPEPGKCQWMALHAPPGLPALDALNHGAPVFRSFSAVLDPTVEHEWDLFSTDAARWERLGPFETNILS